MTGHCWNYCLFEVLSAGAFTGRFNYLQLARGLALSQPLFVCSLQGVCAERTRLPSLTKKEKGRKRSWRSPSQSCFPCFGTHPHHHPPPRTRACPALGSPMVSAPWVPLLGFAWESFVGVCVFSSSVIKYIFKLPVIGKQGCQIKLPSLLTKSKSAAVELGSCSYFFN